MHPVCCKKRVLLKSFLFCVSFAIVFASSNVILCRSWDSFQPSFASLSASSFPEILQWDGIYWVTVGAAVWIVMKHTHP